MEGVSHRSAACDAGLAWPQGAHLCFRSGHRSPQDFATGPFEVTAVRAMPHPGLRPCQRAVHVHWVHHEPDVRMIDSACHGSTIKPKKVKGPAASATDIGLTPRSLTRMEHQLPHRSLLSSAERGSPFLPQRDPVPTHGYAGPGRRSDALICREARITMLRRLKISLERVRSNTALRGTGALSGLLQQDLSFEAVGVPEEHAQRTAEIVDCAVARPRVHQPLSDRVERFA